MKKNRRNAFQPLRQKHRNSKLLAWILTCALFASPLVSFSTHATEADEFAPEAEGVCIHHPEHTPECGYTVQSGGQFCSYVCALCVTDWSWNDEENVLVQDDEGRWGLGLPGAGKDNPVTEEILEGLLPQSITAQTPAGEQTVALSWDYSTFTDPAYTGEYLLTASLEGEYALTKEAPALEVLAELGGGETYADHMKFLNQWSFIARDGSKLTENTLSAAIEGLKTMSDNEVFEWLKDNVLPTQIRGWANNSDTSGVFGRVGFSAESDQSETKYETKESGQEQVSDSVNQTTFWIRGPIAWRSDNISVSPSPKDPEAKEFTLYASIPTVTENSDTYNLYVNSNNPEDHKNNGPNQDTRTNDKILALTVTVYDLNLKDHTVPAANLENVTVNLFDYWVRDEGKKPTEATNGDILTKSDSHYRKSAPGPSDSPTLFAAKSDWNKGINSGHLLLFGDGMIHAGLWNKGAGQSCNYGKNYAGMEGIVKNVLPEDGYPEIDLAMADKTLTEGNPERKVEWISDYMLTGDHNTGTGNRYTSDGIQNISNDVINSWGKGLSTGTESLQYLFDPDYTGASSSYRTSYKNVTGLFQLDNNGYYYYDMRENFAEFQDTDPDGTANNHFTLYDAPATIRTDAGQSIGNFFPFNKGTEVFTGVNENTHTLTSSIGCSNNSMNHHLGMTINADFRQPSGGYVHTGTARQPMTFEFAGDDDVWVFIDDVLVLDLGGIHSEIYGTVDFSTGDIYIGRAFDSKGIPDDPENPDHMVTHTTLRDAYKAAQREESTSWNGNTFASDTPHTLRMFYLERGNYDSSIALRFNLQQQLYQRIEKVDQNGQALPGVEFTLHPAEVTTDTDAVRCLYTDEGERGQTFFVQPDYSEDLVTLKTESDGSAVFLMPDGNYFNFADRGDQYYALSETTTPNGYRSQPEDIILHYNSSTSMLSVANLWTTGAYSCSTAHLAAVGQLHYGVQNGTVIEPGSEEIPNEVQRDSLVVAIPMLRKTSDQSWLALSGSNMGGFSATPIRGSTEEEYLSSLLQAALTHVSTDRTSDWHLNWDDGNRRLYGTMDDLPGLASRYQFNNPDGDMNLVYGMISPEALNALGITTGDSDNRYETLRQYLKSHTVDDALSAVLNVSGGFRLLSTNQFSQDFRSLIYIPNERRELHVIKVDQDGSPLANVRFGLYEDPACSGQPVSSGHTDSNGKLIFSATGNSSVPGQARIETWGNSADDPRYYLKEISAPAGYITNPTITPIVVGKYSIYADAGDPNDGVSVMASVGRLTQTMRQYAQGGGVDITLQDITAFMQSQSREQFQLTDWKDELLEGTAVRRSMNLHFGINTDMDYGLHDEDGGSIYDPFFVTDTGFIRARVEQNYNALNGGQYEETNTDVNKENLNDIDLTNLFSLLNIVVVTNWTDPLTQTGQLTVGKMVKDSGLQDTDYNQNFTFTLQLQNPDGTPLRGSYYFYGNDKAGYIEDGKDLILHHDEKITILGLPAGTSYTVTEKAESGWWPIPDSGTFSGEIADQGTADAVFTNTKQPGSPPDPGTGGEDPGTGGENPGTGGEDPGTGGENPGTGGEDPGTGGEDPGTGGEDPGTGGEDPGTGGDPGIGEETPGTVGNSPDTGSASNPGSSNSGQSGQLSTGDMQQPVLWMFCALLSLSTIIFVGFFANKKKPVHLRRQIAGRNYKRRRRYHQKDL